MNPENEPREESKNAPSRGSADWRFIAIVLVVMILPFVLFSRQIETLVRAWVEQPVSPEVACGMVAGLLWADVLLPIPSSVVITFAGAKLGWWSAFLASDAGMMLGSLTAFLLGRFAAATGLARQSVQDQQLGASSLARWGKWAIILTRGIPLVAEIVLIYVAAKRIGFWTFFWPTLIANTAICLGYALLGQWAAEREWFAMVLGMTGVVPLLLGIAVRRTLSNQSHST